MLLLHGSEAGEDGHGGSRLQARRGYDSPADHRFLSCNDSSFLYAHRITVIRSRRHRCSSVPDPSTPSSTVTTASTSSARSHQRTPVVDAAWNDGALVLTVDLPGTPADAVDVSVAGRALTIAVATDELSWERSVTPRRRPRPRAGLGPVRRRPPHGHRRCRGHRRAAPRRDHQVADRGGSAGERHQRQRLIRQRGELGRHRHEVALRRRPPDLPHLDARHAAGRRARTG